MGVSDDLCVAGEASIRASVNLIDGITEILRS